MTQSQIPPTQLVDHSYSTTCWEPRAHPRIPANAVVDRFNIQTTLLAASGSPRIPPTQLGIVHIQPTCTQPSGTVPNPPTQLVDRFIFNLHCWPPRSSPESTNAVVDRYIQPVAGGLRDFPESTNAVGGSFIFNLLDGRLGNFRESTNAVGGSCQYSKQHAGRIGATPIPPTQWGSFHINQVWRLDFPESTNAVWWIVLLTNSARSLGDRSRIPQSVGGIQGEWADSPFVGQV